MRSMRVRGAAIVRGVAAALVLLGIGFCEPASAQYYYRGYGFPFFGNNPWFFNPRPQPEPRPPRRPREHHEAAPAVTGPPPAQKAEVAPAKTGIVLGDSMAEWLAYGLEQAYADSHEIGVVRKTRSGSGLVDQCQGELRKWIEQAIGNEKPAFIAVMIGLNDRRSTQACGPAGKADSPRSASLSFRSKEWAEAYGKEVDEVIGLLKGKGVPVLWVGLPPARNVRAADLGYLNDLFREHADKNGIAYVDVWDGFVDEDGDFTMRGPDVNGQTRLLRAADGLNFTKAGARKLALFAEREIGRTGVNPAPDASPPVASRDTNPAPAKPSERPTTGPVVPLTRASQAEKDDTLLGGKPVRSSADSTLLGGEPAKPARGRADDFSWPRPQESGGGAEAPGYAQDNAAATSEQSDVKPGPGKPRPRTGKRKSGDNAH